METAQRAIGLVSCFLLQASRLVTFQRLYTLLTVSQLPGVRTGFSDLSAELSKLCDKGWVLICEVSAFIWI